MQYSLVIQLSQGSQFLQGFRSADQNRLADAWDEIQRPQLPFAHGSQNMTNIPLEHARLQPDLNGNTKQSLQSLLLMNFNTNSLQSCCCVYLSIWH